LVAKHPVKVAVATTTSAALPGLYSAGKSIGTAADKVTASLLKGGSGGLGLAGMSLPVLILLGYLLLKR
jgi:hypothetical protein